MHDQFFITLKKHLDERMSSSFKRAPMVLCRGTAKRHKVICKQLPRSRRKRFKVLLIKLTSISTCFSYLIPRFGQSTTQGLCHKIIRLFLKFCYANSWRYLRRFCKSVQDKREGSLLTSLMEAA